MKKSLSPLLINAIFFVHNEYLSKPYTDIFDKEPLLHYNELRKIQLEQGVVHRPNHNIVHTLRSLRYIRFIIDILLNYGKPSVQLELMVMNDNGSLESFCQKIELACLFKVTGRSSEVSRPDFVQLYAFYRMKSAQIFRDFVDGSQEARRLFSSIEERDFYQNKVLEDLGNPENQHLPQLILRLAHDLDLHRCRSDEIMWTMQQMYDRLYLQSGYSFEPLWQFAKSCIHETGGSVIIGYNKLLYDFTENPLACWQFLTTKEPYEASIYRESVKGNLNLNEISRIIREGNAIARVVSLSELELKMLADPKHVRPLIETTKDRALYKTSTLFRIRTRKQYLPIERQAVALKPKQQKINDKYISYDVDRGNAKETPYTKKMSVSLVNTDGSYIPYADNRLGFLYDDSLLNHKGDQYIWSQNAGSITKPWLNGLFTPSLTKASLLTHMRANPTDKINNELLRGLTRHGLRALFYPYRSNERINLFYEYLIARDSHHNFPRIPLLLWDYDTGTIHFYDLNLIRADLIRYIGDGTLLAERLQKICLILNIKPALGLNSEQLSSAIVEHFISWEYSTIIKPNEKSKELLFKQIVYILKKLNSQEELKSLGIFCKVSGKILEQPVVVNCDDLHLINFETLLDQPIDSACALIRCPMCKQAINEINIDQATMNTMYFLVAEIIRTRGIREILEYTACSISTDPLQSLFNLNEKSRINLISLVAIRRAERAIKQENLPQLIQLLNQNHLIKFIVNNSKLLYSAALSPSQQMLQCLLQYSADINGRDEDKGSPLHYAAFNNSETAIRRLLENKANPNSINQHGLTPLHLAAQYGRNNAVNALLSNAFIIIDSINPEGYTPLITAVKYGEHEVVERLIRARSNVNHINNAGDTALHLAAEYGNESIIDLLLKTGANPHCRDQSQETPLFRAAAYGRGQALLLLLQHNKQHIDRQNSSGNTALHLAVQFNRIVTVKILLDYHANMEVFNQEGDLPLHLAIKFNRQNILQELMQHGADYQCKNKGGNSPLVLAQKHFDKSLLICFNKERNKREAPRARL